jgi:NADH-quinone oxidoreductase subunit A
MRLLDGRHEPQCSDALLPRTGDSRRARRTSVAGHRGKSILLASETGTARRKTPLFDDWLPFAMYAFFALAIPASMVMASFTLATRPKQRVRARTVPFESGVSTGTMRKQRFTVSFYLTAMLFILFDIEIVFLYPLAVILNELAWFGFAEFVVFLGILLLAYVYIWRKGALEWR